MDKLAKKKKEDDWSANEDGHVASSGASTKDISRPLSDAEIPPTKRLPELASGEPSKDSRQLTDIAGEEDESSRGW